MASLDKILLEAESHDTFLREFMGTLASATRVSNTISKGLDHDYSSSFGKFREEKKSCIDANREMLEKLLNFCKATDQPQAKLPGDVADPYFYDLIIDAVDSLLDKADRSLSAGSSAGASASNIIASTMRLDKDRIIMENIQDIPKPQLAFLHEISNSRSVPFRPALVKKYCALVEYDGKPLSGPAPDQCDDDTSDPDLGEAVYPDHYYPHPYEREVQQAALPDIAPKGDPSVPNLPGTPFFFVDTTQAFAKMLPYLQRAKEIAIDLEHHSVRSFQGLTCVMQISTREADFVIDALELRAMLPQLGQYFARPDVVKVFHGSDHDLMWLQRDFSLYIVTMFDTYDAATALGLHTRSFAHLVHHYCQVKIPKTHQLSDWRRRPLPQDMKDYARGDTHYLLRVYDHIRRDLVRKLGAAGLEETLLASRKRCLARYEKAPFRPMGYRACMRGNRQALNPAQEQALARLWDWRDDQARKEDESVAYVMSNAEMLRIAALVPRSEQEVIQAAPLSAFTRAHLGEVVEVVRQAMQMAVPVAVPRSTAPRASIKPAADSQCAGTVFTFTPLPATSAMDVDKLPAEPGSPRLLETDELFLAAGWKSPEPAQLRASGDRSWSPLILAALRPAAVSEENRYRVAQVLDDLKARLDPTLTNPLAAPAVGPRAAEGSVMGESSALQDDESSDAQEVAAAVAEGIPQSFEEIYKLSSKTRKKNKQKKAAAGSADDSAVGGDQGPGFDFQTYFAADGDAGADTGMESTLAAVQQVGWVQPSEAQAVREECAQVADDGAAASAMRRSFEKHPAAPAGGQRLYSSYDRHPTSGKAQAQVASAVAGKTFDYTKVPSQSALGALPSQAQAAAGGGRGGKGGRGGRGGAGRSKMDSQANPYMNAFAKK